MPIPPRQLHSQRKSQFALNEWREGEGDSTIAYSYSYYLNLPLGKTKQPTNQPTNKQTNQQTKAN